MHWRTFTSKLIRAYNPNSATYAAACQSRSKYGHCFKFISGNLQRRNSTINYINIQLQVLIITGSLTTCDPGDISSTISTCKSLNIRCSVIALSAEVSNLRENITTTYCEQYGFHAGPYNLKCFLILSRFEFIENCLGRLEVLIM